MKKTNNKGFSLVELIVVIAIMAVLMGVLAPQFLKYVEKSRAQRDASAVGEVYNATKIALADEKIAKAVNDVLTPAGGGTAGTVTVTISNEGKVSCTSVEALLDEITSTTSGNLNFASTTFKSNPNTPITFSIEGSTSTGFKLTPTGMPSTDYTLN